MSNDTGRVASVSERSDPGDGLPGVTAGLGLRFRPTSESWFERSPTTDFVSAGQTVHPTVFCTVCGMVIVDAEPYREVHVERCTA